MKTNYNQNIHSLNNCIINNLNILEYTIRQLNYSGFGINNNNKIKKNKTKQDNLKQDNKSVLKNNNKIKLDLKNVINLSILQINKLTNSNGNNIIKEMFINRIISNIILNINNVSDFNENYIQQELFLFLNTNNLKINSLIEMYLNELKDNINLLYSKSSNYLSYFSDNNK